jgi:hypothetical protein
MRRVLLLATAAALAIAAVGSAAPQPASTLAPVAPAKRRVVERRDAIKKVEADLGMLVVDAKVPAPSAMIRAYKSYMPRQLSEPASREVRVEALLEIVKDDKIEGGIREEAASAIYSLETSKHDADLDWSGKGMRRQRALFSKKVLDLLKRPGKDADDVFVRAQADLILKGLWPAIATQKEPEINACQPRSVTSCTQAKAKWEQWLAR